MRFENFERGMNRIAGWFHKKLSSDNIEIYYRRIGNIPDTPWEEILDNLIDETAPIPSKFPTINFLKNEWYSWQRAHPERVVKRETVPCDQCHGHGILWYRASDEKINREYVYVCRCDSCLNWKKHFPESVQTPALRTRMSLEEKGLDVWPYTPIDYKIPETNIDEMINNVGFEVPF